MTDRSLFTLMFDTRFTSRRKLVGSYPRNNSVSSLVGHSSGTATVPRLSVRIALPAIRVRSVRTSKVERA